MIFRNVKILTMDEAGVIENGDLVVENGRIVSVIPTSGTPSGLWVMPGMIDAHTHLGLQEDSLGFEGDDLNEITDPITPHLRAIDGVNPMDRCFEEARRGGITCVAVAPGSANPIGGQIAVIKTAGRRIDDMILSAPAAMKMALGENPKTSYHEKDEAPETRMATAALIRETLFKAQKYAKDKQKAEESREKIRLGQVDPEDEVEDPDFDMKLEAMIPVVRGTLPVHFHAHRTDDLFTAIRIAKEFGLRFTLVHCTEGYLVADLLAKEGVTALVGPNLCDRCKPELKAQTFENPGILTQNGIRLGLTTDHPVNPVQYLPLCAALACQNGMSREDALRSITLNPAVILGISDRVGSLKPGKDADLVVTDGDPLLLSTRIRTVCIDGQIVTENKA